MTLRLLYPTISHSCHNQYIISTYIFIKKNGNESVRIDYKSLARALVFSAIVTNNAFIPALSTLIVILNE